MNTGQQVWVIILTTAVFITATFIWVGYQENKRLEDKIRDQQQRLLALELDARWAKQK